MRTYRISWINESYYEAFIEASSQEEAEKIFLNDEFDGKMYNSQTLSDSLVIEEQAN
jgi:hypothetical protein